MKTLALILALALVLPAGAALACGDKPPPCPDPDPDPIDKRDPGSGGGPYGLGDGIHDCDTPEECKAALVTWSFVAGAVGCIPCFIGGLIKVEVDYPSK